MFSLRVLTWFEYPNILISGDYRPPIIQEAFTNRVTYTWDQTDLGMPSAYTPRILLPSYFLMTIFNTMGINIYTSQMIMIFLMIFFASTLMYFFSKKILSGNVVAAFFAGLYITANIYLVIDREITVINFLDAILVILPCVIMFTEGITKKSYKYIALSGILFPLTYGAFPNYRNSIVCIITIFITSLFYLIKNNKKISCNYKKINFKKIILIKKNNPIIKGLKYIAVFIIVALLASIWIITILWNNADLFTQTYGETGTTSFVYEGINLHDTFRLITKWGFYAKCIIPTNENGVNLVPYANEYLQNPTIITLSYIPTIIAFLAILTPKNRKTTIFFSITALTFLILASGLNPLFGNIYSRIISNIPLMLVFGNKHNGAFS